MMRGFYGLTLWMVNCLSGFRMEGWDDQAILQRAGIQQDTLSSGYCSFDIYNDIFSAAEALYGESACIVSRRGMLPNSFQSLSLAMLSSSTLLEALQLNVKHGQTMTNGVDWFLTDDGSAIFGFTTIPEQRVIPAVAVAILTMMVKTARFLYPGKNVIERVELGHATSDQQSEAVELIERYFKVPVEWSSHRYCVHYCEHVAKEPLIFANHALMKKCERSWLEEVAGFEETSFLLKAGAFVRSNISNDDLRIELLANELSMSVRTLQRRLESESSSFKKLVDQARQSEAMRLITDTKTSISEVAYSLGFADVGSLSRAFKRWSGSSPDQYRKTVISAR